MTTQGEDLTTKINLNIFFKEFTFSKNEFYPDENNQKELADNIVCIDDLLLIYQIKDRDPSLTQSINEEIGWFKNKVLKKAKNQIKTTISYLKQYDQIFIENNRGHKINVSEMNLKNPHKVIIYLPGNNLPLEYQNIKFYESKEAGAIHLFSIRNYNIICDILITPTEINNYLLFRVDLLKKHGKLMNNISEKSLLGQFLSGNNSEAPKEEFSIYVDRLNEDNNQFSILDVVDIFSKKITTQTNPTDYYLIIKEIAKLDRRELQCFKERYLKSFSSVKKNEFDCLRVAIPRINCGFVFIALKKEDVLHWRNALENSTLEYKYLRKLNKCIGMVVFRETDSTFNVQWAIIESPWEYSEAMEEQISKDKEVNGEGHFVKFKKYIIDEKV